MVNKKFILVTGSHRSGSTWTGDIISSSPEVRYVHEPFNIGINPESPLKYWYQYIPENENPEDIQKYLENYYRISLRDRAKYLSKVRNPGDLKSYAAKYLLHNNSYLLVKDPLMFFSAEWFAKTHHTAVIITIRHPAAFVASLKVKNWFFDFYNLAEQPDLMQRLSPELQNQVIQYSKKRPDIIDTGICMWNIIHHVALQYKEKHPDWMMVRHEDLSDYPVEEFKKMFERLEIPFTSYLEKKILNSTQSETTDILKRNAGENKESWRKRLTESEIEKVLKETKEIASEFGY